MGVGGQRQITVVKEEQHKTDGGHHKARAGAASETVVLAKLLVLNAAHICTTHLALTCSPGPQACCSHCPSRLQPPPAAQQQPADAGRLQAAPLCHGAARCHAWLRASSSR